jgi:RimJ/RimL family protein N-acetyltransferase
MKYKYIVPYKIMTSRTTMRCWEPEDAQKMQEAINLSIDSLRPWMPWAKNEPSDFRTKIAAIQKMREHFDLGTDFVYGIFTTDESEVVGSYGLEIRDNDEMEIGCWISAKYQNKGYSTESTRALIRTAFEVCKIGKVRISFNGKNYSSLRVAEKSGFSIQDYSLQNNDSNLIVFVLTKDDYVRSDIMKEPVAFYNSTRKTHNYLQHESNHESMTGEGPALSFN